MNEAEREISRRPMIAVIGDGGAEPGSEVYDMAVEVGRCLVDAGFRVVSGGMGGVMEAAFVGARSAEGYREGDTVAILPGLDRRRANAAADVVVCTELGHLRNSLVAASDGVVAVGGGAGTLCEISLAWLYGRLIVAIPISGWSRELAGRPLDRKVRPVRVENDLIHSARNAEEAAELILRLLPGHVSS